MDFNKLEKELSGLMQKDDKYWRENDAKFRAAKQMATYEEFENIVKVWFMIEIILWIVIPTKNKNYLLYSTLLI